MSTEAAAAPWPLAPFALLRQMRLRRQEAEGTGANQYLMDALEQEKHEGQRIATIARTIALGVIAVLLPYVNPNIGVLYYEAFLIIFIALGWAQFRVARVGRSGLELALIFADLALLTFICIVPSPYSPEILPTAYMYRFGNFIYFFVLLAVGTLAYSWRTVATIGLWVALLWLLGLIFVILFGRELPNLSDTVARALAGHPLFATELDPNGVRVPLRIQETVVFLIVSRVLALKGWRSNLLLIRQADIAAERANLSRYFSPNIVDALASRDHDIGAVRTQEVAVLFADIVGFTELAERIPPQKVMELLRRYHSVIGNAVFQNGGTLDKYLGDGVMATFGTPNVGPSDAANALKAARQIVADVDQCSRDGSERGDLEFRVSVGIHFGPVILGDIGPSRRLEFAVVGDTVNVASRLETATRELKCRIVSSNDLFEKIDRTGSFDPTLLAGFEPRHAVSLRGRKAPIDVWVC